MKKPLNRPTNAASRNAWADIWLGCMDCTLKPRKKGTQSKSVVDEQSLKITPVRQGERLGNTFHQNSVGKGLSRSQITHCRVADGAGWTPHEYAINRHFLGASPREIMTGVEHIRLKYKVW